jgi:putative transposase
MGYAYTIKDQGAEHFVTFTVHQWVDVFTRSIYVDEFLASLRYCQEFKGLEVFAWVIMSNHIHMIIRSSNLSDIIRDIKKFTAKAIYKSIIGNPKESRKDWILRALSYEDRIWFWEEGYHGEEIYSLEFYNTKVNYIHLNPVRAGIVEKEEEYINSSAGEFYGIRRSKLVLSNFG